MTGDSAGMASAPGPVTTAAGTATPMPATGTTHTVNMVLDAQGAYKFEPANLTAKAGDAIKFVAVSGMPHNVAFEEGGIPAGSSAQLTANIQGSIAPLTSDMAINPNQEIMVSLAGLPAGTYNYNCTPHLAMNMKGVITVQ